jgi:hypothetical protein
MQLLQINRTRDFIEYEISVFGSIGSFFNSVGNKQLRDIDLSDYNHIVNLTNITDSWFTQVKKNGSNYDNFTGSITTQFPNGQPIGEGYTYPLIYDGYAQATGTSINFELPMIRGAVYAKQLVDSIFNDVGFTYTSTFLNTQMFKNLIIPFQRRAKNKVVIETQLYVNYNVVSQFIAQIRLVRERADNGQKDYLFTYDYFETILGFFTEIIPINITIVENGLEYGDKVYLEVDLTQNDGVSTITFQAISTPLVILYTLEDISAINGTIQIAKNTADTYSAQAVHRIIYSDPIVDNNNTWNNSTYEHTTPAINLQSNLHANIKQVDYLMSLVKMFNLYIDIDKEDDKNLIIEPYIDFIQNTVVDWTMKLDNSRQIEIYPMGELDFSTFRLKYKDDIDYFNKTYTSIYNELYGEKRVDINNDFVRNENRIEIIFSPTHLSGKVGSPIIPQLFVLENNLPAAYNYNIRILHYAGLIDGNYSIINDPNADTVTTTNYTKYPFTGHTDDPQNMTLDLLFDKPRQVYWILDNANTYTDNNLYNKYWEKYISEITDKDSKIVKMWLYLNVNDINQLDFTKKYFIDNSYYRLNKIENYNPINEQVTKCEFLKIKEGSPFVAGDTDNPIDNLVNYNLVIGGVDEIRNIAADSFYNVVVGGKDEVRNIAATSPFHIIRG